MSVDIQNLALPNHHLIKKLNPMNTSDIHRLQISLISGNLLIP